VRTLSSRLAVVPEHKSELDKPSFKKAGYKVKPTDQLVIDDATTTAVCSLAGKQNKQQNAFCTAEIKQFPQNDKEAEKFVSRTLRKIDKRLNPRETKSADPSYNYSAASGGMVVWANGKFYAVNNGNISSYLIYRDKAGRIVQIISLHEYQHDPLSPVERLRLKPKDVISGNLYLAVNEDKNSSENYLAASRCFAAYAFAGVGARRSPEVAIYQPKKTADCEAMVVMACGLPETLSENELIAIVEEKPGSNCESISQRIAQAACRNKPKGSVTVLVSSINKTDKLCAVFAGFGRSGKEVADYFATNLLTELKEELKYYLKPVNKEQEEQKQQTRKEFQECKQKKSLYSYTGPTTKKHTTSTAEIKSDMALALCEGFKIVPRNNYSEIYIQRLTNGTFVSTLVTNYDFVRWNEENNKYERERLFNSKQNSTNKIYLGAQLEITTIKTPDSPHADRQASFVPNLALIKYLAKGVSIPKNLGIFIVSETTNEISDRMFDAFLKDAAKSKDQKTVFNKRDFLWAVFLMPEQVAAIKKQINKSDEALAKIWQKNPSSFFHFYSYFIHYEDFMQDIKLAALDVLKKRIVEYQHHYLSYTARARFEFVQGLQALVYAISQSEEFSAIENLPQGIDRWDTLNEMLHEEKHFLQYKIPTLIRDWRIPEVIAKPETKLETKSEKPPSFFKQHKPYFIIGGICALGIVVPPLAALKAGAALKAFGIGALASSVFGAVATRVTYKARKDQRTRVKNAEQLCPSFKEDVTSKENRTWLELELSKSTNPKSTNKPLKASHLGLPVMPQHKPLKSRNTELKPSAAQDEVRIDISQLGDVDEEAVAPVLSSHAPQGNQGVIFRPVLTPRKSLSDPTIQNYLKLLPSQRVKLLNDNYQEIFADAHKILQKNQLTKLDQVAIELFVSSKPFLDLIKAQPKLINEFLQPLKKELQSMLAEQIAEARRLLEDSLAPIPGTLQDPPKLVL